MRKNDFEPRPLEGFTYYDQDVAAAKVGELMTVRPNQVSIVADWDGTLTAPQFDEDTEIYKNASSWGVLQQLLPLEGRNADQELYEKYRAKERDGSLKFHEAQIWWYGSLGLQVEYGTNLNDIGSVVERYGMPIRDGAVGLFRACETRDIPLSVLSAGVLDVIHYYKNKHKLTPAAEVATKLTADGPEEGKITGWQYETVTHCLNKKEMGAKNLGHIINRRSFTVVIGDSAKDASMVEGDNVLNIQVTDKDPLAPGVRLPGFHMAVSGSLDPVRDLVSRVGVLSQAA